MPPQAAANLRQMEPGSSGFIDPWCLVELQYTPKPIAPDLDSKAPPPTIDPHSGQFYLFPHKPVYSEPTGDATMAVERRADSGYAVDLTGHPLANPPRLESQATVTNGEYVIVAEVKGLEGALVAPPPTTPTTETDATQSEPAKADAPTAAKPAATTPTAPKSVPVTAAK